ncbi:malto-oligosyltrehalose trehalohydrolase [Variibacter gotjawalensis]|uniref:Malto-oligosyltrehalose trehalohydrolase n=1 Tax=Variibacter gotjawalensis TaxID=1333996 RepID=A0A0S3PSK0_9BRAD|nr:malto-oligosyltrehalose trehalohydrolase [Variibacter gotjawalensis]NIK49161.1 malto-oligosyltrehalose trehalohydrolase [Variibacter gotjawalensis]RZS51017.1 maltooligosyl trehalose hydrolase [Variibacter gotjawalensis]BAT58851.1 malto-oligosyltrehalose trehalohydrolase [Variibacter gotjawalensis]
MSDGFGPLATRDGVLFRLWAPSANQVRLLLDGQALPMRADGGWYSVQVPAVSDGSSYLFEIDGDLRMPDPGSRFQPDDVHGPSAVAPETYGWRCKDWKGRPFAEAVFYELHIGTFTPEGTYRSAIDKLDHLVACGITALQIMPLSDFPGRWNWGYDGVLPFAPDSSYGTPDDLKALIDTAHERGLMVFLDVVYNHFGPDGNYLHGIAREAFSDAQTPWGEAIDYRKTPMRSLVVENVLYWLRDVRFDGLRFDAVHAIVVPGEPNILAEISHAAGELARETGRHIHLVLENDDNAAQWLDPLRDVPNGRYRAQWNDDYHHAWHVLLTGETAGYYKDYDDAGRRIARSLAEGFVYQGEASRHRDETPRGEPSAQLSPLAFVNFLQNHDQIGNRALGERLTVLAKPESLIAAHTILLLAPAPPMLFMGEEWGAREPFPFFCDFKGDLANAVREGRKREFAEAYADSAQDVPDPLAESTFKSAKLDWSVLKVFEHEERLHLTAELLRLRREHIVPFVADAKKINGQARFDTGFLVAAWATETQKLTLIANLSDHDIDADVPSSKTLIWGGTVPKRLPPWSVYFSIGDR